jgi:hypothetical protein
VERAEEVGRVGADDVEGRPVNTLEWLPVRIRLAVAPARRLLPGVTTASMNVPPVP